jgi:hypothetical protein
MVPLPKPFLSRLLEVREVLMFSFDFELLDQPLETAAYTTPSPWLPAFTLPGVSAEVIGRDAMGGVYVAYQSTPSGGVCCLHLDTRGHVVLLGGSLQEAVALLVALPYWHELLLESDSVGLEAMREHAEALERDVCDDLPALPDARDYLRSFLSLPELIDPVARLCELTAEADAVTVLSPHGWRYEAPVVRARRASEPPPLAKTNAAG